MAKTQDSNDARFPLRRPDDAPPPPRGTADDLTRLPGINARLAERLGAIGITSLAQIAALTPQQVDWIEFKLGDAGRVRRERWIERARDLLRPPPSPRAEPPPPAEPLELRHGLPPRDQWAMPPAPSWQTAEQPAAPPPPAPPPPPEPVQTATPEPQPGSYTTNLPVPVPRRRRWRWVTRGIAACLLLFMVAVAWLALTAPLSKSLEPPAPPSITLLSAEGTPIARRGADIAEPVDATKLPAHVRDAFIAIEDRRFYRHWGVDPRGTIRALVNNLTSSRTQGGSTITQQLAKNAFLNSSRTAGRKFQEALIAFWLEAWLTKDEILSRYLSNVYFGDNAYGLSAAARHYFSVKPEELTISQATMLAGLVQAPSRLAPSGNLSGARERQKLVIGAMVDAGLLREAEAEDIRPARLKLEKVRQLPNGGYFADWVLPQARDRAGGVSTQQTVRTTLETGMQQAAERAVRGAGLKQAQIALVAMRPDGRVVAMVGGTDYKASPFNRATQARRQPGSTFKLFVYLAALRSGMTPESMVDDSPVTIGDWSPENSGKRYAGRITLRQAFAKSSNVVAARLTQRLGVRAVTRAARDLGISTPIGDEPTIGLGTSTVSLLELTAAYAAVAEGAYPVRPSGLTPDEEDSDWLAERLAAPRRFPGRELDDMREMLSAVVQSGTGRGAALSIPAFGKTGTTQDSRDALFIGYAGGLVAGVWMGNDDNSPNPGLSGSGLPARVWRDFMTRALDLRAAPLPPVEELDNGAAENEIGLGELLDEIGVRLGEGDIRVEVDSDEDEEAPPAPPGEREERDPALRPEDLE